MKRTHFMVLKVTKAVGMAAVILCLWIQVIPGLAATTTPTADYSHEVATAWFNLQLRLVKETPGFSPPVASRAFGYTGVTLYEAVVAGMPDYQSLIGQLNELTAMPQQDIDFEYHWPTIANSALATITRQLFPTASEENQAAINTLYDEFAQTYSNDLDTDVFNRSVSYGQDVANAVFAWSIADGGHEGYLTNFPADYLPAEGAGLWVPTPRLNGDPQPAMQPYWGNNRTFLPSSIEGCAPSAPSVYSEDSDSAFYAEAIEVYQTSQNLTQEQTDIALFWADDPGRTVTPPGHSIAVLTQILEQENATLALSAEAYARMGIAVADAFIGCWHAKYTYNLVRPVTYIQRLMDENWMPLVNTPPFPEYPSGHSVQSGAAAVVLAGMFGEEYAFTDHTHDALGLAARSFDTFTEMANEAALSRLYGGIHYRAAIELGLEQGTCIGERVNSLIFRRYE
jgi:PAP2 superfamily